MNTSFPSPQRIKSTNELLKDANVSDAEKIGWKRLLKRTAKELLELYKNSHDKFLNNKEAFVNLSRLAEIYDSTRIERIWQEIIGAKDITNPTRSLSRYIKEIKDNNAYHLALDHILLAYAIVKDELSYYLSASNKSISKKLKLYKNVFRNISTQPEIHPPTMFKQLIDNLEKSKKLYKKLLLKLIELKRDMEKTTMAWIIDIVIFLHELDPMIIMDYQSFKLTDKGVIPDDGLPHEMTDSTAGGMYILSLKRTKNIQKFMDVAASVWSCEEQYVNAERRLQLVPNGGVDRGFLPLAISQLANIIQWKYVAGYVSMLYYATRMATSFQRDAKQVTPEISEMISKILIQSKWTHTFCWDVILSADHDTASREYWYLDSKNVGRKINGNEEYLFATGSFQDYTSGKLGVMRDDVYEAWHEKMLITYLCNSIYIHTHTSYSSGKQFPSFNVYRLIKSKEKSKLKTALTFYYDQVKISGHLANRFKAFLTKYKSYTNLLYLDSTSPAGRIFQLKIETEASRSLASPYITLKENGTSKMVTSLEMCVLFLLDLIEQEDVEDIYLSTTVAINDGLIKMKPHIGYKCFSLPGLPKNAMSMTEKEARESVLGLIDTEYTAPTFFSPYNFFGEASHERLYTFSIDSVLNNYIDENIAECMSNYIFLRKIFERFEDLRLGYNVETLHLAGTSDISPMMVNIPPEILPFSRAIDSDSSIALESLLPTFNENTVVYIEKNEPEVIPQSYMKKKQQQSNPDWSLKRSLRDVR